MRSSSAGPPLLPEAVAAELACLEELLGQAADAVARRQLADIGKAAAARVLGKVGGTRRTVSNMSAYIIAMAEQEKEQCREATERGVGAGAAAGGSGPFPASTAASGVFASFGTNKVGPGAAIEEEIEDVGRQLQAKEQIEDESVYGLHYHSDIEIQEASYDLSKHSQCHESSLVTMSVQNSSDSISLGGQNQDCVEVDTTVPATAYQAYQMHVQHDSAIQELLSIVPHGAMMLREN